MKIEHVVPNIKESPIRVNTSTINYIDYSDYSNSSDDYLYDYPIHVHTEIEIIIVLCGNFKIFIGEKTIDLVAGDIIMINRDIPHGTQVFENTKTGLLQIDLQKLLINNHNSRFLSLFMNENKYRYYVFRNDDEMTKMLQNIIFDVFSETIENKPFYELYVKGNILKILGILYRNGILDDSFSEISRENLLKIMPSLEFIENNYMEKITLDDISKAVHLNSSYFCRMFKRITKKTVFEYLNFVRIHKSTSLLKTTDKTITEISYETGFSSISYYNRCFIKQYQCTPTFYRKILFE